MDVVYLGINEVRCYEYNPRSLENPNIKDLEISINANGLLSPFAVTQRPNERDYILYMGANSRLRIVQEKYRSGSPDEQARYQTIPCQIFPWKGEMDVMLKHGIENSARGEMAFIEEARYIKVVQLQVEAERDKGAISSSDLAKYLFSKGYSVHRNKIAISQFTCDYLEQAIPKALETGFKPFNATKLRKLWKKFEAITCKYNIQSAKEGFQSVLSEYDDDFESFKQHDLMDPLAAYISKKTGMQVPNIIMELGLTKASAKIPTVEQRQFQEEAIENSDFKDPSKRVYHQESKTIGESSRVETTVEQPKVMDIQVDQLQNEADSTKEADIGPSNEQSLDQLRKRSYLLAVELAKCSNNEAYVIQINANNGFVVDMPKYTNGINEHDRLLQASGWWQLAGISDQFTLNEEQIEKIKPVLRSTRVIGILDQKDLHKRYGMLENAVDLDVHHLHGATIQRLIKKKKLEALNSLVKTCYQIKGLGHEG